jgi:hypothetical protein
MTGGTGGKSIRIWILGLHHSGTTIVWRAWRKDARFLCFDEPLTGDIGVWFPKNNPKRSHDEYANAFREVPRTFWSLYAPIDAFQELDGMLTAPQERYLSALLDLAPNVVVDETHLHFHLSAINKLTPDGYVIHLHRSARSFVTSHLLPSRSRQDSLLLDLKQRFGHAYRRRIFWKTFRIPPGMDRDKVVGQHPHSKFGLLLSEAGYDAQRTMRSPALVRLLAYWHYCYHHLEHEGRKQFGPRFISLAYESFATDPKGAMAKLYDWIGLAPPKGVAYSDVHPPKSPFRADDPRWRQAARAAGFREDELDTLL